MGLQIKLVHPLGERLIELEPRSVDNPLVVGRSPDCDISVPSVNVSKRHCVLFVHEGQWVVQDAGSGRGTFIDGQEITEPTYINLGDVVTLGTDPRAPTLVVDPLGVARASVPAAVMAGQTEGEEYRAEDGYATGGYDAAQGDNGFWGGNEPRPIMVADDDAAALATFSGRSAPGAYAPPAEQREERLGAKKQQGMSGATLALCGAAVLVFVGLVWWAVAANSDNDAPPPAPAWTPPPQSAPQAPKRKADNIFQDMMNQQGSILAPDDLARSRGDPVYFEIAPAQPPQDRESYAPAEVSPPPAPSVHVLIAQADSPPPPAGGDADSARIRDAHDNLTISTPELAIVVYEDYLSQNPNGPLAADCKRYEDECLDQLWWMRVEELTNDRQDLRNQLAQVSSDLAQETDADYKKKLTGQRDDLREAVTRDDTILREMNVTTNERPNLLDPDQMARLRKARDAAVYAKWKVSTFNAIKRSGGHLSWKTSN